MNQVALLLKPSIILMLIACISIAFTTVEEPKINVNAKGELSFNDIEILDKAISELEETIQKADRKKSYPNGEISHFYDKTGIVITEKNGKIKGLGINFNWDGDDKFPETSFTGSFSIGEVIIDKNSGPEDFKKVTALKYDCPGTLICISSDEGMDIRTMVAFKEGKITQWAILKK
ncbi:hypothetical protein GYB22_01335 [bacterium]|nr:hypothetical protein [bacterium]